MWMAGRTRAGVLTFGFGPDSDVQLTGYSLDWPRGSRLRLRTSGEEQELAVRLIGRTTAYAIAAGFAAGLAEQLPADDVASRLEALAPTPGRMQPVSLPNGAWLLRDDFKSTYETIEAALDTFAEVPAERRIVVLGEVSEPPGSQGPIYRHIGRRVAQTASLAVFVGHNFQRYAAGAARAGMSRDAMIDAGGGVMKAIEFLHEEVRPGDVVLLKGRDNQKLERVALALQGRDVRCNAVRCRVRGFSCAGCPALSARYAEELFRE
jgi:UDP-N-acetylmuramoyl-tripeptide--D-alanyl-D-alanine ligase